MSSSGGLGPEGVVPVFDYVVLGGGVAGVCCAQELARNVTPAQTVALVSASPALKIIHGLSRLSTSLLETFEVEEEDVDAWSESARNITLVRGYVTSLDSEQRCVTLSDGYFRSTDSSECTQGSGGSGGSEGSRGREGSGGSEGTGGSKGSEGSGGTVGGIGSEGGKRVACKALGYRQAVAVCTGASPELIADHPLVLGIRDTDSVRDLSRKLQHARRVMLVGNGGIGLELASAVQGVEVVWSVRDPFLGHTFLDASASALIMPSLRHRMQRPSPGGTSGDTDDSSGEAPMLSEDQRDDPTSPTPSTVTSRRRAQATPCPTKCGCCGKIARTTRFTVSSSHDSPTDLSLLC